jgi:hypothetical protein
MGDLRKTWQAHKFKAVEEFKKAHPVKDVSQIEVFPLAFKLDLGPNLDNWEKAKKPEDKKKYSDKASIAIKAYKTEIDKAKIPDASKTALNQGLTYLKGKLGLH